MRRIPVLTAAILLSILFGVHAMFLVPASAQQNVVERLGIPGPLRFGGADHKLAWSSKPTPGYFKQEYLPDGQAVERYASMLMIELLTGNKTIKDVLAVQVRMLAARKKQDPVTNYALIVNEDSSEAILDFVMHADGRNGERITEWNGYRYTPFTSPSGKKGVLLLAVSRHAYGDDASIAFLRSLKQERHGMIEELARARIPMVSPGNNR